MPGRPFKSRLREHVPQIKTLRRKGMIWRDVCAVLASEHGIKTSPPELVRFMTRFKERPYPLGAEPEEATAAAVLPDNTQIIQRMREAKPPEPIKKNDDEDWGDLAAKKDL